MSITLSFQDSKIEMQVESFFNSFYLRMSLPSLGRVKTQLKWKGYMYAQPFESLYNTKPSNRCLLSSFVSERRVRKGLENISYWEYAHTKSAQVFLLVASSSLVRCGKCSGLLNVYAEIGRYLRPLGKLSLTTFAYARLGLMHGSYNELLCIKNAGA